MKMQNLAYCLALSLFWSITLRAEEMPRLTTLSDESIRYSVPAKPYVILKRGDIEAVVVDNRAVDDDVLPGHRAGYSGIASLKHTQHRENLFVPSYAGLNFEHIHDGTQRDRRVRTAAGHPARPRPEPGRRPAPGGRPACWPAAAAGRVCR